MHERLGRAVHVPARIWIGAGDRAHVHDVAAPARDHPRQQGAGHVHETRAVRLDHPLPIVEDGVLRRLEPQREPRVVDEHVDIRERRWQRCQQLLDGGQVTDVEHRNKNQILAEIVDQLGKAFFPAGRRDDLDARGRIAAGDGLADARAGAGDESDVWWHDRRS